MFPAQLKIGGGSGTREVCLNELLNCCIPTDKRNCLPLPMNESDFVESFWNISKFLKPFSNQVERGIVPLSNLVDGDL